MYSAEIPILKNLEKSVLEPLDKLQRLQRTCIFSSLSLPPRESGMT